MSYEDLTVIFQKLQICLLIFYQKSDERADRNANPYNLINQNFLKFFEHYFQKVEFHQRQNIFNIVKDFACISAKKA